MKFTTAAAGAALLAARSVLAAPAPAAPSAAASPDGVIDLGNGVTLVPRPLRNVGKLGASHGSDATDDLNWAGAVLIGTDFTEVTGTITVPEPSAPSGGKSSTQYAASAWVGIDGDTCQTAILQTGVDFYSQDGEASFDAWYEWYPNYAYTFSGFSVSEGNVITMTVTATSKKAGSVTLENQSTGQTVTHSFSSERASLCQTNAEWIVEDFEEGSSLVAFADFGTVTFTGASAVEGGSTVGVSGSQIFDIEQNGKVLTNCGTSGSSSIYCTYE